MKEKIIEILKSYSDYHYLAELERTAYVISDFSFTDVADAILSLPLYEKEFVEWIGLKYGFHELALREIDMKWLYPLNNEGKEYSHDELYDYWKEEIKK